MPKSEQRFPVGTLVLPAAAIKAFGDHPDLRPGRVSFDHADGTVDVTWTPHTVTRDPVTELVRRV